MFKRHQLKDGVANIASRFCRDKNGSVMTMAAITLPVIMLSSAVALQHSMTVSAENKVQLWTDTALMAGVTEASNMESISDETLVKNKIKEYSDKFLQVGFDETSGAEYVSSEVSYNPETKVATLTVSYKYPTVMASITGDEQNVQQVIAEVILSVQEKTPLSMYLVLDKSGSMGWNQYNRPSSNNRMVALKAAVASLTQKMINEDPDKKYVRMGAVAYSSYNYHTHVSMNWDPATVNTYTQSLSPGGGTNSSGAMRSAYYALRGNSEETAHATKNEGDPKKFIIFMTDGVNNHSLYDVWTKSYCRAAKDNEGVEIYSVAFQAPPHARNLLKQCASSTSHYFEAENSAELIASFETIGDAAAQALAFSK